MARRGVTIILTLLGAAIVVSVTMFVLLYFLVGRQPPVPSDATLMLRVGGDLAEATPDDVFAYLRSGRTQTVQSIVATLKRAKADARVTARSEEHTSELQSLR